MKITSKQTSFAIGAVLTSLVAASLVACGGGENQSGTQATSASSVRAQTLSAVTTESVEATILPGDPDWGTTKACTGESDFVQIDGSTDPDKALKSRHVYCMLLAPESQAISVDLMRNANDSGWEYYNRSAGRSATTFTVGTVKLYTLFQAFGPASGLNKAHKLGFKIKTFTPDPGFPLPTSGLKLSIAPRMTCDTYAYGTGTSAGACTNLDSFTTSISLQSGATAESSAVAVGFSWSFDSGVANAYDWASFKVGLNGVKYAVNDTQRPDGYETFVAQTDGSSGSMVAQEIRCDRGVVPNAGSGCVMPRAAAVFVMDTSTRPALAEAAEHAYNAQRTLSPGQSVLSPGRFSLKVGTRAVAAERGEPQYQGLEREVNKTLQTANRKAACTSTSSLYATRPYQGSASCPTASSAGCSCDEYPFAATKNGAAYSPDSVSVKGILSTANSDGGLAMADFFRTERVTPPEAYYEKFWVEAKR